MGPKQESRTLLFYDGQCLFCRKAIAVVKSLDWLGIIDAVDVFSLSDTELAKLPSDITRDALLEEIHLFTPRRNVLRGFFAFRSAATYIPLGWLFLPLFWFPGAGVLGPKIYRWIARNRYNICRFCKK